MSAPAASSTRDACSPKPSARGEHKTFREEAIDLRLRHGGVLEIRSKIPIRDHHILNMLYVPPAALSRPMSSATTRPWSTRSPPRKPGRHRHRWLGGARSRRHRSPGRATGDGGQGNSAANPGRRRGVPDLSRRARRRRDRRHRPEHRPEFRWHQPRRHQRALLLRDRAQAA